MNIKEKINQIELKISEGQNFINNPSSTPSDYERWKRITSIILKQIFSDNPDFVKIFDQTPSDHSNRVWNSASDPKILIYVKSMAQNQIKVLSDFKQILLQNLHDSGEKELFELLYEAENDEIGLARLEPLGENTILAIGKQKYFVGEQYSKRFNDMIDRGFIKHEEGQRYRITYEGRKHLGLKEKKEETENIKLKKRFAVALSFAGEKRDFIEQVYNFLSDEFGREKILYDKSIDYELARPSADNYLQKLYTDESELIVVFFSKDYEKKEWCGLEWRAIRDLMNKKKFEKIMFFRFDDVNIDGLYSLDASIDIEKHHFSPRLVAKKIIERYKIT